jgi:hypothetical protein
MDFMILIKNKTKQRISFSAVVLFLAAAVILGCAPAAALTPANTNIAIPNLSITADGGAVSISEPSDIPSLTVLAVSGVAWTATPTGATIATGQSAIYQFAFSHNGNIGINPVKDSFYITVSSTWLAGVYQDAAATVPASGTVDLPPNSGNTYTFYVKITAPVNAVGQTNTLTATVHNAYYQANTADDPFGDPDRISATVTTTVPDNVPPVLALTAPADSSALLVSSASVTGTTEPGVTGVVTLSPSGATAALTIDAGGAFANLVALSQGTNTITVQVKDAALNTTTAARTVAVDSIKPGAVIASPAQGASILGAVTVTGSATDTNFTQYALYYGPGTSPTAWGTVTATSTIAVSSGALGAWDTSSLYGDYTLRLAVVDSFGNVTQATRTINVGNGGIFTHTLPVDTWTMVSVPGIPYNPDPAQWFGSTRFEVQRWDPAMAAPDPYLYQYRRTFSVSAGQSFWVKPYDTPITYSVNAWVPDTTQPFEIPVSAGWNQIGNPYNRAIAWNMFQFRDTASGVAKSIPDAIAANLIDSSIYSYSSNNYNQLGAADALQPETGYFMKAFVNGALIIEPGAGRPGGVARMVRARYDFKLQLAAQGAGLRDTDNFAGVLLTSSDGHDPADAGEPPLVEPYLTLHFPHEDWPERVAGRYASDLRPAPGDTGETMKTWTFVVETSEPNTPVTVSWPNAHTVPDNYEVTVTDVETGDIINPKIRESYQYTATGGAPRVFRLAARKVGAAAARELAITLAPGWNLISVPLEPENTDARAQLGDDMRNPAIYQYYNLEYYNPDSAQRVDIQAGLGYWIYADSAVDVDFEGAPTNPAEPLDVPLARGWNLIGNPFATPVAFDDTLAVVSDGRAMPLSEAAAAGLVEARIFRYNTQAGGGYEVLGPGAALEPWQGYIIKALTNCTLRFSSQ